MALYNKYRPRSLAQVSGQEHIKKILINQVKNNDLVHAYLFTGPAGTGKTTVARIVASMVNCSSGLTVDVPADDKFGSLIMSGSKSQTDVIELDAATSGSIEDIRDLRSKLDYGPTMMNKKVFIIDECHRLSSAAWEGLLKMLEEPPKFAMFILCTTEPDKVTETVLTRCMVFDFRALSPKDVSDQLRKIAESEKIEIDEGALALLVNYAKGSLRLGISALEKLKHLSGKIDATAAAQLLGSASGLAARNFIKAIINRSFADGMAASSSVLSSGGSVADFLTRMAELCHDMLVCKAYDLETHGYTPAEAKEVHDLREMLATELGADAFRKLLAHWIHLLNTHVGMVIFNIQPQFQANYAFVEMVQAYRKFSIGEKLLKQ